MHSHVLACRLAVQGDAGPLEPKSVIRFVRRLPAHGEAAIATQRFRILPRLACRQFSAFVAVRAFDGDARDDATDAHDRSSFGPSSPSPDRALAAPSPQYRAGSRRSAAKLPNIEPAVCGQPLEAGGDVDPPRRRHRVGGVRVHPVLESQLRDRPARDQNDLPVTFLEGRISDE